MGRRTDAGKYQKREVPQVMYRSSATTCAPPHANDSTRKGFLPYASLQRPTTGACMPSSVRFAVATFTPNLVMTCQLSDYLFQSISRTKDEAWCDADQLQHHKH